MTAAFEDKGTLHIILWTGRVRLHAGLRTFCEQEGDAANGVMQVPDSVFASGSAFKLNGASLKPCPRCRLAVQAAVG